MSRRGPKPNDARRAEILRAVVECAGNLTEAGRRLGISKQRVHQVIGKARAAREQVKS